MISPDKLKKAINQVLPQHLAQDVGDNIHASIQGLITQMDLVSRDEFEIQQKILIKTRQKLDALEKLMKDVEKRQT